MRRAHLIQIEKYVKQLQNAVSAFNLYWELQERPHNKNNKHIKKNTNNEHEM